MTETEQEKENRREIFETKLLNVQPAEIEKTSFSILSKELEAKGIVLSGDTEPVIKRCIHTTADFQYASTLTFSKDAVAVMKKLLREGACIVTDTNMALSGINKTELSKYGGEAFCFMAEPEIARIARERGCTRATVSMEHAASLGKKIIFAVGNAPTALVTLCEMADRGVFIPDFVIGVPVGFVNVEQAKEMVLSRDLNYIVNRGRKGGSNVAAAIVNAVLYAMRDE
ncbi:MAG: precorrin-8X methylmutase [Lachnospiraceae bacterium]|nr:precorrin-8X methylmutase [Lachnospiraceae bacterium]